MNRIGKNYSFFGLELDFGVVLCSFLGNFEEFFGIFWVFFVCFLSKFENGEDEGNFYQQFTDNLDNLKCFFFLLELFVFRDWLLIRHLGSGGCFLFPFHYFYFCGLEFICGFWWNFATKIN